MEENPDFLCSIQHVEESQDTNLKWERVMNNIQQFLVELE